MCCYVTSGVTAVSVMQSFHAWISMDTCPIMFYILNSVLTIAAKTRKRILTFHTFMWTRFSRGKAGKRNPRNSDRGRNDCRQSFGPPHSSIALSHFLAQKPGFKLRLNYNIYCSLNCIFCADSANSVLLRQRQEKDITRIGTHFISKK